MPKLKVFRTSIGFHDAYVAAPSRAAALRAWGANTDLFAVGAAELIEEPKLTEAPLAEPGKVVRVSRGTISDHLGSLESSKSESRTGHAGKASRKAKKPPPRPSRAKLDRADARLSLEEEAHQQSIKQIEQQIAALRGQLEKEIKGLASKRRKFERAKENAEADYEAAMRVWRESL